MKDSTQLVLPDGVWTISQVEGLNKDMPKMTLRMTLLSMVSNGQIVRVETENKPNLPAYYRVSCDVAPFNKQRGADAGYCTPIALNTASTGSA